MAVFILNFAEYSILSDDIILPFGLCFDNFTGNVNIVQFFAGQHFCFVFRVERLKNNHIAFFYKALQSACADVFVRNLPNGLDTVLGERGSGLSEGTDAAVGSCPGNFVRTTRPAFG